MGDKPTAAQAALLRKMGIRANALRNGDEHVPMWWIEGGDGVKANTANSLIARGWIKYTGHWGGQPGILGYTSTDAGRRALEGQGMTDEERARGIVLGSTRNMSSQEMADIEKIIGGAFAAIRADEREKANAALPDYIEIFRIIKEAGRKDSEKSHAIAAAIRARGSE